MPTPTVNTRTPVVLLKDTGKQLSHNSGNSSLADIISGISSTTEQGPYTKSSLPDGNTCISFSTNSAQGKALSDVDDTKHINNFHKLISKELPKANDLQHFTKVMSQGSDCSVITSNMLHCTKSALALFNLLPEDKMGKVKNEAVDFYQSMLKLSNDGSKEKTANSALEKFNAVLFKQLGLTEKGIGQQENLDKVCNQYLQESVYPDIIEKLSNVLPKAELQSLRENPKEVIQYLYPELNQRNDEQINELKKGFINHHEVNDKAAQMHSLMTALEHKTEIIARLLGNNAGPDSLPQAEQHSQTLPPAEPPVDYNMGLPASSPHTKASFQRSPMSAPLIDYNMASPTLPPPGNFSPVFSPVNNVAPTITVAPIINVNLGELAPLITKISNLADAVAGMTLPKDPVSQGRTPPTRRADIPDVIVPAAKGQPEKIAPEEIKIEKQSQPAITVSKARTPLVEQKKQHGDDEVDSTSTPISAAVSMPTPADKPVPPPIPVPASSVEPKVNSQTNEALPKAPVKKATYQLNSQGNYFGTQGNALPSYRDVPVVALTNGATLGSSQSSSYRNSDTSHLAQKNASLTESQRADIKKAKETDSTQAPKSVNAFGSEFMGMKEAQRSSELIDLFQKHNDDSSLKVMDKTQPKSSRPVSPSQRSVSYERLAQQGIYKEVLGFNLKEQDNGKLVSVDQQDKASGGRV
ncbi:hypothetical protein [Yersinia massiliensis]|uniref:hypothetical protein n=1 Tax=Yersinia massiliensis TaxID=419257 RepID=UPI001CFCB7EE|nr:hypothetical protein [Yersinia massiliensis]MCB5307107.1 hypothetical protein [Yersinia massiliensis]